MMARLQIVPLFLLALLAAAPLGRAESPGMAGAAPEATDDSPLDETPASPDAEDGTAGAAADAASRDEAGEKSPASGNADAAAAAAATTSAITPLAAAAPLAPLNGALRDRLTAHATAIDEQTALEAEALAKFYEARQFSPLWVDDAGPTAKASSLMAAIKSADAYGLEAGDYNQPKLEPTTDAQVLAALETRLSKTALLYARHARGGRIMKPSEQLNSNIDRKPQLLEPADILAGIAAADDAGAYLVTTHPKHEQFEKLRQAYLKARGAKDGVIADPAQPLGAAAKRLRANMEMWRWMYDDMGEMYVFNNIPEFMQRVYKNGQVIRSERIVAGMRDKQSSVFSRPLAHVVLRPKWRVPESIMVHELWPSLLKGGGLMREYGLQLETKSGKVVDWRQIDWTKDDIRNYYVMQPPGRKSVLGVVKYSFPSQHTIFMHDTPDKWMFRQAQRTLSHGCLRLQKPVELAEIVLDYDKGWDKAKVAELIKSGPLNNAVKIDKRIMINLVYFTAWVEESGKLRAFADVYGHERRVALALEKKWDKIDKGRNHLAPPKPQFDPEAVAAKAPPARADRRQARTTGDIIGDMLGLSF